MQPNRSRSTRNACRTDSMFESLEHRRLMSGGSLDPTFGAAGKAAPNLGFGAVEMAVQRDGKALALGHVNKAWVVARLDLKGALDKSFGGGDGIASIAFDNDPLPDHIAIAPNGKIVMAGIRGGAGNLITGDDEFVVARLNADGSPDASFGKSGKVAAFSGHSFTFIGNALAVQPDGKIVLAHSEQDFHFLPTPNFEADFFVGRLNADGSVDKTFGEHIAVNSNRRSGFDRTDMGGFDLPSVIAIAPDGKIVVGGTKNGKHLDDEFGKHEFLLARYTSDGRLDKSFDGNGKLATFMAGNHIDDFDELKSIVVQPDGKIIAGGLSGGQFALVRYNVNGSIDTNFAGGRVFTNLSAGQDMVNSLFLDSRGNITAVGTVDGSTPSVEVGKRLAAVQYLPNGLLDRSFGNSGIATLDTKKIVVAGAGQVPGGKIVVAGRQSSQTNFFRFNQVTPIVEVKDLANNQTTEGSPDPAAILIERDAKYDFPTRVFLDVSGRATEGVDYTSSALHRGPKFNIPNNTGNSGSLVPVQLEGFPYFVDIPAGADFAIAEILAKADGLGEGDENIHWAPIADATYQLGAGNAGHVTIHDRTSSAAIRPRIPRAAPRGHALDSLFSDDRIDAIV